MNLAPIHDAKLERLAAEALRHPTIVLLRILCKSLGANAYLVGGPVRDLATHGQLGHDIDICITSASAQAVAEAVATQTNGAYVLLDETHGIHRVVLEPGNPHSVTLDIAAAFEDDLKTDLARRDLSINAMAIELDTGHWFDPFYGLADLEFGTIRMVSEKNLLEDPLRMLRVFRFAAQLMATVEDSTLEVVKANAHRICQVAGERIHVEFFKLLKAARCFETLKTMGESGLLEAMLPEFTPMREIPPNGYHHLGLYDHTLELVNQAERLLGLLPENTQQELHEALTPFASRMAVVKLACLLHDVGKPTTKAVKEDGRFTYYGHDAVSEEMTEAIGRRWKLSGELLERTKLLVRWHLYPCQFGPHASRKSVLRFYRKMGPLTPDVVLLALADRHSTLGKGDEATLQKDHDDHMWLLNQYYVERGVFDLPRLMNGQTLMSLLGMAPGPQVGEILTALREAQELGEVKTEEEAKDWVQQNYR